MVTMDADASYMCCHRRSYKNISGWIMTTGTVVACLVLGDVVAVGDCKAGRIPHGHLDLVLKVHIVNDIRHNVAVLQRRLRAREVCKCFAILCTSWFARCGVMHKAGVCMHHCNHCATFADTADCDDSSLRQCAHHGIDCIMQVALLYVQRPSPAFQTQVHLATPILRNQSQDSTLSHHRRHAAVPWMSRAAWDMKCHIKLSRYGM